MSKYIDAEKLIVDIERQQRRLMVLSNTEQVDIRRDCALQNGVYDNILGIIDSLQQEQTEVDFEKEIKRYQEHYILVKEKGFSLDWMDIETTARHFYELGKARKEE